jgi:hypothetical protein
MKTKAYTTLTSVAAIAVLGATPAPASAETALTRGDVTAQRSTCTGFEAAVGCFESYGDHVLVKDHKADGMRPSVQWETSYGRSGECTWTGRSNVTDCNYNMREDAYITFRVIVREVHGNEWYTSATVDAYIGG